MQSKGGPQNYDIVILIHIADSFKQVYWSFTDVEETVSRTVKHDGTEYDDVIQFWTGQANQPEKWEKLSALWH